MSALRRAAALAVLVTALTAVEAAACPACADPTGGRTAWFRYTTVILSLVPLAAIGGVLWWIKREVTIAGSDAGA